jgi:CRISPR/Cas system-associated exonuclease Cas4 (RecB family)
MEELDFSKIYSYSKLNLFNKCKKNYYLHYLDPDIAPIRKLFLKPRDYKTKGQAVHGAITLFYHLPKEKRTFESLKECLTRAWFSEVDPLKNPPLGILGGFEDLKHERKTYLQSLKLLKNLFQLEEFDPPIFYLPTETIKDSFSDYERLIKPLDETFFISGKFDRIDTLEDGTLRVIDFKTSKGNSNQFQLLFYKLLAELNFQIPVRVVSFYYLNRGEIVDFDVSDIGKDEVQDQVLKKIKRVEKTKKFSPQVSGLCAHCDFLEICPAKKTLKSKTI